VILASPDASLTQGLLLPAAVSLVVTLLASVAGWWWQLRQQRRAEQARLYADAYAAVQAYKEFPYVVHRRNPDEPAAERVRISEALRGIQQDISFHTAWVELHGGPVAAAFERLVTETRRVAGELIRDAWNTAPVGANSGMNISDVGPPLSVLEEPEQAYLDAVRRRLRPLSSWRR
jgi:hypothetical protein